MRLLDTSVVVDVDRGGVAERVERLDDEGRHAISVVTVTELRHGVDRQYEPESARHEEAVDALERLLARFDIYEITRPVAVHAGAVIADLRDRGVPLHDLHDVYVAATARTAQLPVLTANVDHFERIEDVRVDDWNEM